MNAKLHYDRALEVWPILVEMAKNREEGTPYGKLSERINVHARAAHWYLGVIQDACAAKGWPRLQALAINGKSGLPGGGYHGVRTREAHDAELEKVYQFAWPKEPPF